MTTIAKKPTPEWPQGEMPGQEPVLKSMTVAEFAATAEKKPSNDILAQLRALQPELTALHERLNLRIEEEAQLIRDAGVALMAMTPLEDGVQLVWQRHSKIWTLMVRYDGDNGVHELEALRNAPRELRLKGLAILPDLHRALLTKSLALKKELEKL